MALVANLPKPVRVIYVLIGAALAASPLFVSLERWEQVVLVACGLIIAVTGATGW